MLTTIALIIGGVFIYLLWHKVKALQKYLLLTKEITRLQLRPKQTLYELPLIREAMGLDKEHHHIKYKELSEKESVKVSEWTQNHDNIFRKMFTFFWDKELIFLNNDLGTFFIRFPYKTRNIYFKELGTTKDGYTIEFNITFRYMNNILDGKKVPVYTGYLKKSKSFKFDDQIVILFNFPHAFINPVFCTDKNNQPLIHELEEKLKLET